MRLAYSTSKMTIEFPVFYQAEFSARDEFSALKNILVSIQTSQCCELWLEISISASEWLHLGTLAAEMKISPYDNCDVMTKDEINGCDLLLELAGKIFSQKVEPSSTLFLQRTERFFILTWCMISILRMRTRWKFRLMETGFILFHKNWLSRITCF